MTDSGKALGDTKQPNINTADTLDIAQYIQYARYAKPIDIASENKEQSKELEVQILPAMSWNAGLGTLNQARALTLLPSCIQLEESITSGSPLVHHGGSSAKGAVTTQDELNEADTVCTREFNIPESRYVDDTVRHWDWKPKNEEGVGTLQQPKHITPRQYKSPWQRDDVQAKRKTGRDSFPVVSRPGPAHNKPRQVKSNLKTLEPSDTGHEFPLGETPISGPEAVSLGQPRGVFRQKVRVRMASERTKVARILSMGCHRPLVDKLLQLDRYTKDNLVTVTVKLKGTRNGHATRVNGAENRTQRPDGIAQAAKPPNRQSPSTLHDNNQEARKRRGRPKKVTQESTPPPVANVVKLAKRGRGRPPKVVASGGDQVVKRDRGRPKGSSGKIIAFQGIQYTLKEAKIVPETTVAPVEAAPVNAAADNHGGHGLSQERLVRRSLVGCSVASLPSSPRATSMRSSLRPPVPALIMVPHTS
jgi:hypothetical protein